MNPELFGKFGVESQYAALLQQHQAQLEAAQQQMNASALKSDDMNAAAAGTGAGSNAAGGSASKRKLEEDMDDDRDDQPRDKRLRTTILPEQLDYLYQQYQLESNPSRKMLETISREVGLKKRVVQVWFQNTRARERKGQFRAHAQVINKRCPFCPALFKVKSALETHLSTRHPDQYAKGEINIDALPDEELNLTSTSLDLGESSGASGLDMASSSANDSLTKRLSMNYQQSITSLSMLSSLYQQGFVAPLPGFEGKAEDALKRYANDYLVASAATTATNSSASSNAANSVTATTTTTTTTAAAAAAAAVAAAAAAAATTSVTPSESKPSRPSSTPAGSQRPEGGELPLDLSKPIRPGSGMQSECTDDNRSEHYMDYYDYEESNPSSPVPMSATNLSKMGHANSSASMASSSGTPGKRFRTQMSAVQVRVMKSLFNDYKTPTMAECEALGREIGLPKRVVQVWFQNARAKEKKHKLNLQKTLGQDGDMSGQQAEGCSFCDFKYSHKYAVQDHIFTHQHIERVKAHVAEQSGKHDREEARQMCNKNSSSNMTHSELRDNSPSNSSTPTSGVGGPTAGDAPATNEALEALLLQQLYGLGYGGVPAAALAAATYNQSAAALAGGECSL